MAVEVKMPFLGESIQGGVLGKWLKSKGDRVEPGDALGEIETEKITSEIYAEVAGSFTPLVEPGTKVEIGQVVAQIEESPGPGDGENRPSRPPAASAQRLPPMVEARPVPVEAPGAAEARREASAALPVAPEPAPPFRPSGGGRVLREEEWQGFAPAQKESPEEPGASPKPPHRKPMSPIRLKIAERLLSAHRNTAHLTTFNEADLTAVKDLRERFGERFEKRHGVRLGFMAFFVRAVVEALRQVPQVGAQIDGTDLVYPGRYDIGIAVSTDRGLIVPVLRDAEEKSFAEIERSIREFAERAKSGKLTLPELDGGLFTITNGGVFGSLLSTPILNPPQSAILGMHAIQDRPVAVRGSVEIRPMMYLALTYDHRVIDGREAVTFLTQVKSFLEHPGIVLLDL
ncbi:2-oxoglutarate dehydrogenase complex dihydrolipoyllysine-residue succinyltransferase [Methylacidimicrobium sp. B4]|uniref:2-oxoglutarate dehydrogenase complex dihydrolipoyllysine-residue succinyltransferase n=1 Tax=Methylacidimicrobium sp. B4 TaxID=2796139 RepID=UPI001A8F41F2|nr:2-oxoglutarate dehydrogenase complex dihydrolipoyllysine-residue succinyltransferase [Methylacidimicrobium sp. B4]QSR84126.1 2-oxoglutarate dehydrogenase complex dihydrolipoyllysine-residue succinyltransferase [Methylacidimicrobium sp. B4]